MSEGKGKLGGKKLSDDKLNVVEKMDRVNMREERWRMEYDSKVPGFRRGDTAPNCCPKLEWKVSMLEKQCVLFITVEFQIITWLLPKSILWRGPKLVLNNRWDENIQVRGTTWGKHKIGEMIVWVTHRGVEQVAKSRLLEIQGTELREKKKARKYSDGKVSFLS